MEQVKLLLLLLQAVINKPYVYYLVAETNIPLKGHANATNF